MDSEEDRKRSRGREIAVQKLLDMHKNGAAYRVAKIMEEGPMEALSSRPINVNRAILEEKAWGLSKYENKGSYLDFPPFCDASPESKCCRAQKGKLKESVKSDAVEESRIRNLVCRHHRKIVQTKLNKTQSNASPQEETLVALNNSFRASPPHQLVSALRKIYGTQTVTNGSNTVEQNNTDERINSSVGNVLPTLLQNIFDHKIFSCEDGNVARKITHDSEEISSHISEKMASANIETIIGNACLSNCDDGDSLQGLLIASVSVLVSCILTEWFNEDDTLKHSKSLNFEADQPEYGIQASGPLSLVCDEIDDLKILDELGGRKFIPDGTLMEYFKNASTIYEEHADIEEDRNISQQPIKDKYVESGSLQDRAHSIDGDSKYSDSSNSSNESMPMYHSSENKNDSGEDSNAGESEHRQPQSPQSSTYGNEHVSTLIEGQDPEDESQLLQEALALSLADINSAIDSLAIDPDEHKDRSTHSHDEGVAVNNPNVKHDIDKDIHEEKGSASDKDFKEMPPSFPVPPDNKLLSKMWHKMPDRAKILDPTAFSDFGKLPAANTFIILLSSLIRKMESKLSRIDVGTTSPKQNLNRDDTPSDVAPFDPSSGTGSSGQKNQKGSEEDKQRESVLHLALACLFILSDARLMCFKYLCEESDSTFGHIMDINDEENVTKDDYYNTDDPAGFFADFSSNVDDRVSSEYLKEKGLIRKAADSAHFAALRKERISQKIESMIELIHMLSLGSFLVLRYLRMLLQELSFQNRDDLYQSTFCATEQVRLATSLSTFTCSSIYNEHYEKVNRFSSLVVRYKEKISDSLCAKFLLFEASALWGESTLFVAQSTNYIEQSIKSLVATISSKGGFGSALLSEEKLHAKCRLDVKWSIKDESVLKLKSVCRRLQCSDALNALVPRPITEALSDVMLHFPSPTSILRYLQPIIFEAVDDMKDCSQSVKDCYLAFCHRINIHILQWGGSCDLLHNNCIHLYDHKLDYAVDDSRLLVGHDPSLKFDNLRCSDTISIVSDSFLESSPQSAIQRAHRVWGTVFGKKCFKPKSGIHRWAVHMSACDKGHIFIGVVTGKASTKTYVGGDKFGWGMIGTKALWHDRKKLKTDYGKAFRTGDTVVLTLDTDSGTLKYSLWKTHAKTSFGKTRTLDSDDSIFITGSLEDWGVAFEGLPLDASLYPAVGMYQRDDKATLFSLQRSQCQILNNDREMGRFFFPDASNASSVRNWNEQICYEGIKYVFDMMNLASQHLSSDNVSRNVMVFEDMIPSLFSSLSTAPSSIPILSGRFAYNLLPILLRFLSILESKIEEKSKMLNPFRCLRNGTWSITYNSPGTNRYDCSGENSEYLDKNDLVKLNISPQDNDDSYEISSILKELTNTQEQTGLIISGSCRGNLIHLIEYHADSNEGSTRRFIEARSNFDGTRFEGTYRNFQDGSTGRVSALYISDRNDYPNSTFSQKWLGQCSFLVGITVEHVLIILSEGTPSRDVFSKCNWDQDNSSRLSDLVTSSIILKNGFNENGKNCSLCLDRIRQLFEMSQITFDAKIRSVISSWYHDFEIRMFSVQGHHGVHEWKEIPPEGFDIIDEKISALVGGVGSLSVLHPMYNIARKGIVRVLLYHVDGVSLLSEVQTETNQVLLEIWRCALNVMETGVRTALTKTVANVSLTVLCKDYCHLVQKISSFLLKIKSQNCQVDVCVSAVKDIYLGITSEDEIFQLREVMLRMSMHAVLKCIGLDAVNTCMRMPSCSLATYGCMISGFRRVSTSPTKTVDNCLGHTSYQLLPAAPAMLQDFSTGIQNNVFTTIASFLREKISLDDSKAPLMSSMQSFLLSVIACLYSWKSIHLENLCEILLSESNPYLDGCSLFDFNLERSVTDISSTWIVNYSVWRTNCSILSSLARILHVAVFQHIDSNIEISKYLRIVKMRLLSILTYFGERYCSSTEDYSIVRKDFETWNITANNSPITVLCEMQMHRKNYNKLRIRLPYDKRTGSSFQVDYLDTLLNTLFTATSSHESSLVILQDIPFVKAIVRFLDESADMNVEISLNLRCRLVRLLRFILPNLVPDENLLSLFLTHLGKIQTGCNGNTAGYVEAKEVISLMRYLFSSSRWLECIVSFMSNSSRMTSDLKMALVSVLGGLPGFISDGSFVLLKPAHNLLPSILADFNQGKGKQSISGTGKSVEGIVSGLCRMNSFAGIISSCDEANSTCEVLLIDRDDSLQNTKESDRHSFPPTIAIRFVRVSFSEIIPTDEIGLLLDDDFNICFLSCTKMNYAIHHTLQQMNVSSNSDVSKTENIIFSNVAKLLRSHIPILSIPELCDRFIDHSSLEGILSGLLKLASTTRLKSSYTTSKVACNSSLNCLPELEARYWYLQVLRSRLLKRQRAIMMSSSEVIKSLETEYDKSCTRYDADEITMPPMTAEGLNRMTRNLERRQTASSDDENSFNSNEEGNHIQHDESDGEDDDIEENIESDQLREVAVIQMMELGLPRSWAEYALQQVGGTNIEAAVHFCLERGSDLERLVAEEREQSTSSRIISRRNEPGINHLLQQLVEMGFPSHWCAEALAATGQNVDDALTWILTNRERLSALDDQGHNEDDIESDEDDSASEADDDSDTNDDSHGNMKPSNSYLAIQDNSQLWPDSILCPVRSITGKAKVDARSLEINGVSSGGFTSVGTNGVLLSTGKWYYECVLLTAGCIQVGWADSSFSGHCQSDSGDGCGDGPSSWAYDGWRRYRWHTHATEWGCRWNVGDVVGCLLDMDQMEIRFTLNGKGEEIGMGLAFSGSGFKPCGGVYACVSFNRKEKVQLLLGGSKDGNFIYPPPHGYKPVGDAVVLAAQELGCLLEQEMVLNGVQRSFNRRSFLCDFSGSEHGYEIFAWQHRYYGSDASVHLSVTPRAQSISLKERTLFLCGSTECDKNDYDGTIDSMLSKHMMQFSKESEINKTSMEDKLHSASNEIIESYKTINKEVDGEFQDVSLALCILYARKAILHFAITASTKFDFSYFCHKDEDEVKAANDFLTVFELCCSLQHQGWAGEAGAMSLASEALGLTISTNTAYNSSSIIGPVVMLNSVYRHSRESGSDSLNSLAACAEYQLGMGGLGVASFLRNALKSATFSSKILVEVMLAFIRRSARLIAGVQVLDESSSDVTLSKGDSSNYNEQDEVIKQQEPDSRLICFLSGLLIGLVTSNPSNGCETNHRIMSSLFESWSLGLLSRSVPWRMVSAMTVSGLLSYCPEYCQFSLPNLTPVKRFYENIESYVSRRLWAERASLPICSRYLHSFIELLSNVYSVPTLRQCLSTNSYVDAATPCSVDFKGISSSGVKVSDYNWESDEGWICSDSCWEIWLGTVEYFSVDWACPGRCAVRSLMDGGEGPPMLREGHAVLRGVDWNKDGSGCINGKEDGKDIYDLEKAERENEKKGFTSLPEDAVNDAQISDSSDAVDSNRCISRERPEQDSPLRDKKKRPLPKLPIGRVIAVESWNGVPGVARRVRWDLTGEESVYRYGGDGGRFDIIHVEVNDKNTRVVKRYPYSETAEQCAARHGFGTQKKYNVVLRIRKNDVTLEHFDGDKEWKCRGILEWPDFGAGCLVTCTFHEDGAVTIREDSVIYGSKDHGWEPRFGEPSYVPGTTYILSKANLFVNNFLKEDGVLDQDINAISDYEELLGSTSYLTQTLRNPENGDRVRVVSELRFIRSKSFTTAFEKKVRSQLPPIVFDEDWHATSLSVSHDRKSITCTSAEGRCSAFLSIGFSKGVHYWEVKIEQADVGSIFIGVAEKPKAYGGATDKRPNLNRWCGWGFVNFRATYHEGTERVYGSHCHSGDTIGVLLECDAGRLSFFYDGVKYGEHILNDLGCAFENLSPFGFNAHGCGGGGGGQGAPSSDGRRGGRYKANGNVRPKTLWPVIGLRHPGDRVTLSQKWMTNYGVGGRDIVRNAVLVDEVLRSYDRYSRYNVDVPTTTKKCDLSEAAKIILPGWLLKEAFVELKRWEKGRCNSVITRAAGPFTLPTACLNVDIDPSPMSCAVACARLGLHFVLLPGDKVAVKRSAGRVLESPEEAVVLGSFQGSLWYKIISQKSEGGSLTEGGERAWFWDESEVANDGIQLLKPTSASFINLPLLDRFKCPSSGGLRITYSQGALLRSDIEISDQYSKNLGIIPMSTVIPCEDVFERRMNSNGVVRFLVHYPPIGKGWISNRIRGGSEELIVELIGPKTTESVNGIKSPEECAAIWMAEYRKQVNVNYGEQLLKAVLINTSEEFEKAVHDGVIGGMTEIESDAFIAELVTAVADSTPGGSALDCPYDVFCTSIYNSLQIHNKLNYKDKASSFQFSGPACHQSVASKIALVQSSFPTMKSIIARVAMIRAFNRRCKFAIPLFALRPSQENSSVLGGYVGLGASVQRSGQCRQTALFRNWIQVQGVGGRVRKCRKLIFTSVKVNVFKSLLQATTTPTSLSHDEYELPRDIRTVRINRLKARKEIEKDTSSIERERTTFGQLHTEFSNLNGTALRRSYVAKGHGGQPRAFKVKLIGEGVNDYSGPYREVFTDAFREVNYINRSMISVLGILQPSPNKYFGVGENRNLNIFPCNHINGDGAMFISSNVSDEEKLLQLHFSSFVTSRSEKDRDLEDCLEFLGRLVSTAVRHGIPVDLDLPLGTVWKQLCEEDVSDEDILKEIDLIAFNRLQKSGVSPSEDTSCSNLLANQRNMFNAFAQGISNVLPIEMFSIFTGEELREFFCGDNDVDVELLKKVAEYEGYNEDDDVIVNFWEVLREMTTEERKLFLQFVWARTRMPLKQSDFDAPFKIQKDTKSSSNEALPSASTCFFTLMLPEYDCKDTLREKLLFAINNVKTMESDYVTNDAEVNEGWRDI